MIPKTSNIPLQAQVFPADHLENSFLGFFQDQNSSINNNENLFPTSDGLLVQSNPGYIDQQNVAIIPPDISAPIAAIPQNSDFVQNGKIFRSAIPNATNKLFCSIQPHNENTYVKESIYSDDCEDSDMEAPSKFEKRNGRRKIKIEFIEDRSKRNITFSKRRTGIMKKAYELSTLTGTQVLLLVASESGHIYTFATPKFQPIVMKPEGKNLIQECLNLTESEELFNVDDNALIPKHFQEHQKEELKYCRTNENIPPNNHHPMQVHPTLYQVPHIVGVQNVQLMGNYQYSRPYNNHGTDPSLYPQPVNWMPLSPKEAQGTTILKTDLKSGKADELGQSEAK